MADSEDVKVYATAPDGSNWVLPATSWADAHSKGFKLRTPSLAELAKTRAESEPIKSAVIGAAHGVGAFGLFDPALKRATGLPEDQAQALTKARLGTTAGQVGSGVGFVGSLFAAPQLSVPGLVGRVGVGAAARVAVATGSKAAGRIAGGMAEGLALGLPQIISENTLDNQPITASHVARVGITNMLAGGTVSGAFHVTGLGAAKVSTALKAADLGASLKKAADWADWHMLAEGNGRWAQKNAGLRGDILRVGRREGVINGSAQHGPDLVEKAGEVKQRVWEQELGKLPKALAEVEDPRFADTVVRAAKGGTRVDRPAAAVPKAAFPADEFVAKVNASLSKFRESPVSDLAVAKVEKMIDLRRYPNFSWQHAFDMQSAMFKTLDKTGDRMTEEVFDAARGAIKDFFFEQGEKRLGKAAVNEFKQGFRDYAAAAELHKALERKAMQVASRGPMGLMDMGAGAIGLARGGPIGGIVGGIASNQLRPRWGFLASAGLREMADSKLVSRLASGLRAKLPSLPGGMMGVRLQIENALARGPFAGLAEHASVLASADGPAYQQAMGIAPPASVVEGGGDNLLALNALAGFSDGHDKALDGHVRGFFGEKSGQSPARKTGNEADFRAHVARLQAVLANPEALYEGIPTSLTGAAPATMGMAVQGVLNAANFLMSKAPKDPNVGLPPALHRPWTPSPTELNRWFSYVDAVERPGAFIERAKNGVVSPEGLEVLKNVYPAVYEELRVKLMARLSDKTAPLPYAKREAILKAFGPNFVGQTQGQIKQIQALHATVAGSSSGGASPDGRQDVDAEKNLETQAQRLERR